MVCSHTGARFSVQVWASAYTLAGLKAAPQKGFQKAPLCGILLQTDRSDFCMRKGEQTRERILLRAAGLFNQKGYFGASLSDVMRVTGLQKGGVYNHFESKEKLALEAFDFALKMITGRIERALSGHRHAAERLLALISVFRAYTSGSPIPGGCPVMNTAIESDDAHPGLQRRARHAMNQWRELLRTIVRKGVERKELRPSADADFVATLFIASLEGAIMLTKLYNDPVHITRVADHLSEYVETTLRA